MANRTDHGMQPVVGADMPWYVRSAATQSASGGDGIVDDRPQALKQECDPDNVVAHHQRIRSAP